MTSHFQYIITFLDMSGSQRRNIYTIEEKQAYHLKSFFIQHV